MNRKMKFYCAGAIRGDSSYAHYFDKIVRIVSEYGEPKTEKFGIQDSPLPRYLPDKNDKKDYVHHRDINRWLRESDALIAEYSGASTGTGFEICYATRLLRIPALCLYHTSALPSLIIKQDASKYTFSQEYDNESELEGYLRCFLEIITRLQNIDDIRLAYTTISPKISKSELQLDEIPRLIEPKMNDANLLSRIQGEFKLERDSVYILKPKPVELDFKDSENFVHFMLKNLTLQKRWDRLASQRIGKTFASGRKFRIIDSISQLDGPTTIPQIYRRAGEERLHYTKEAFAKNVRAYRRIGLLASPGRIVSSSTKLKDQFILVQTLFGDFKVKSFCSPREIARSLIILTQHLHHLSKFLQRFEPEMLVDLLEKARKEQWYLEIPEIPTLSIDNVDSIGLLHEKWAQESMQWLRTRYRMFLEKAYSSYANNANLITESK